MKSLDIPKLLKQFSSTNKNIIVSDSGNKKSMNKSSYNNAFFAKILNGLFIFFVKPVALIYINTFQGNNFPKQYHALNTVFRSLHSYADTSNIFYKINYDGQNFQAFT